MERTAIFVVVEQLVVAAVVLAAAAAFSTKTVRDWHPVGLAANLPPTLKSVACYPAPLDQFDGWSPPEPTLDWLIIQNFLRLSLPIFVLELQSLAEGPVVVVAAAEVDFVEVVVAVRHLADPGVERIQVVAKKEHCRAVDYAGCFLVLDRAGSDAYSWAAEAVDSYSADRGRDSGRYHTAGSGYEKQPGHWCMI